MHIRDLHADVELDSTALTAIRGGSSMLAGEQPQYPELPTFGGDWTKFNAEVQGYIGDVKSGAGIPSHDIARPSTPEIAVPVVEVPAIV